MISVELRDWLENNAQHILYGDYYEGECDSPLPTGWQISDEPVAHYGGEDQGSEFWTVWRFTNGDNSILIRIDGWYQSYHGAEYESFREVTPQTKTVTVYE